MPESTSNYQPVSPISQEYGDINYGHGQRGSQGDLMQNRNDNGSPVNSRYAHPAPPASYPEDYHYRPTQAEYESSTATNSTPTLNVSQPKDTPIPTKRNGTFSRTKTALCRMAAPKKERWTLEIISIILALFSQSSIIVILSRTQNQPLESTWQFYFSINTVISTLTALEKALMLFAVASCLGQLKWVYFSPSSSSTSAVGERGKVLTHFGYFDDAARGPLGALRILLSLNTLWGWGAYLGSVVVLLSVAVDPFTQQVVSFPVREAVVRPEDILRGSGVAGAATVPSFGYSHNYTFGAKQDYQQIVSSDEEGFPQIQGDTVDMGMIGAITAGLYNISAAAAYNCSSKCRWDGQDQALGGSYVSIGFESICSNVTLDTVRTEKCQGETGGTSERVCNMTTPGGIQLETRIGLEAGYTALVVGTKRLDYDVVRNYDGMGPGDAPGVGPVSPKFLRAAVLNIADWYTPYLPEGHLIGHTVTECEFSLSAWRYSNVSATGTDFTVGTTEKISLNNGTYIDHYVPEDEKSHDEIRFDLDEVPQGLFIRDTDFGALADFLSREPFTGKIASAWLRGQGPGIRSGLLKGNIAAVFDTMARSMTDYVRSGPGSSLAYGSRIDNVVFVQVEWGWLALPLVSVVAATVLLAFTMFTSSRVKGLSLWKDKTTPLLFTYYDSQDGSIRTQLDNSRDVEVYAGSVKAVLR